VIESLQANASYIPYRDSSLTYILRDSLGAGDSKALVIACLSPLSSHCYQSKKSLDFAKMANRVVLKKMAAA
jgi:hypothetical protein